MEIFNWISRLKSQRFSTRPRGASNDGGASRNVIGKRIVLPFRTRPALTGEYFSFYTASICWLIYSPSKVPRFWRHVNGRRFITAERCKLIPFKLIHFRGAVMNRRASTSQRREQVLICAARIKSGFFFFFCMFCFIFSSPRTNKRGPLNGFLFMTAERLAANGRYRSFFSLRVQRRDEEAGVFGNSKA